MTKRRRSWSSSEKLEIIKDSEVMGVTEASRKHEVSSQMIYRWRNNYEAEGLSGLESKRGSQVDAEKKNMEREIERLRQVVADQALTIRIKDELLKKNRYR